MFRPKPKAFPVKSDLAFIKSKAKHPDGRTLFSGSILDPTRLGDPEKRYELLLEAALDSEEFWTLEREGSLLRMRLPDGRLALPLWPSQELAALEAHDRLETPKRLGLDELLEAILPQLVQEAALIAAFPQKDSGLVLEALFFLQRLEEEWEALD